MKVIGRHWRIIMAGLLGWTLFGVFFALQGYATSAYLGQPVPFWLVLALWLICGYAWMFLTPVVVVICEKFFIKRGQLGRNLLIHFLSAIFISIIHLSAFVILRQTILGDGGKPQTFLEEFKRLFFTNFHFDFLIYWILTGIWHLREINRRYLKHERETARLELAASQLETRLAQARLDALKMQLHPHFLFNTLNSISVLMHDDPKAANKMLVRLSELLRTALKSESAREVSLKDELEFLRGYLEIEQTRFQDRLKVDFEVDNEALEAQIPNLILQPIVENAIRHGIAPRVTEGNILIRCQRENGFIELNIIDNGSGLDHSSKDSNGIGLKNTRERLERLYGEQQRFEIISPESGGLQVKIKIPYHTDDEH